MEIRELQRQLVSATKTLNSRLRRLRAADLPSTSYYKIRQAQDMDTGYITPAGYVSASYAGLSPKQLQQKLKWVRGITADTETVKQARALVQLRSREWGTSPDETKQRIRAGRVFYQVLGYRNGLFDSDRVHYTIEEFDKTPSYETLIQQLYLDYGVEMQNEIGGRDELLKWMNETHIIPPGVHAAEDERTGKIYYV